MKKKAILYTNNTEKLATLAQFLVHAGWEILSAGKTATFLKSQNISCTVTPYLGQNANSDDGFIQLMHMILASGRKLFTSSIYTDSCVDLVCMDIVPMFRPVDDFMELDKSGNFMDLQKVTLMNCAAKNYKNVITLTDPADYEETIVQIKTESLSADYRLYLAGKTLNLISAYHASDSISIFMKDTQNGFPEYYMLPYKKELKLKNGHNADQECYMYSLHNEDCAFCGIKKIHGREANLNILENCSIAWKAISTFMNISKKTLAVETTDCNNYSFVTRFAPATGAVLSVIIKNVNPVGAALAANLQESIKRAMLTDPEALTGAVIGCSSVVDESAAYELLYTDFRAVIAPDFTKEAKEILSQKPKLRLIIASVLISSFNECISIDGGLAVQKPDHTLFEKLSIVTQNRPTQEQLDSMAFGMIIAMIAKSDAAVIVNSFATAGISSGNTSRKKAVRLALEDATAYFANNNLSLEQRNAEVLISDSKIMFDESTKKIVEAGVKAVMQTGGTETDADFIQFCNEHGISMIFTGVQHISY